MAKDKSQKLYHRGPEMKSGQKGVSLIITFFIMIIILAIVLSISVLLYSEVRVIRNMSNSMASLYAAESGIEKVLYYDKQVVPKISGGPCSSPSDCVTPQTCDTDSGLCTMPAARGLCSIFTSCTSGNSSVYCNQPAKSALDTDTTNTGCDPDTCDNCKISFDTTFDKRTYNVTAQVSPSADGTSALKIQSYGASGGAQRAIELTYVTGAQAPPITPPQPPSLFVYNNDPSLGTITSSDSSINCGTACSGTFTLGQPVTISALPSSGAIFSGWSEGCSGSQYYCTIVMNGDTIVNATFTLITNQPQTAYLDPNGDNAVAWTPSSGNTHHTLVDEGLTNGRRQPAAADTNDYVTGGSKTDDDFDMTTANMLGGTANYIKVWVYAEKDYNSSVPFNINIFTGGVWQTAIAKALTTSWAWYSATWTGTFTQDDINNLIVRIYSGNTDNASPVVAEVYAEINYVPTDELTILEFNISQPITSDIRSATLIWNAVNASRCTLNGPNFPIDSPQNTSDTVSTGYLTSNSTYTLTCYDSLERSVSQTLTVLVPAISATQAASTITRTSAVANGSITVTGGQMVSARGFKCYQSLNCSGTENDKSESGSFDTGSYPLGFTGLSPNTTYSYKAYATNSGGTSYGSCVSFVTNNLALATVTVSSASNVLITTATLNGNITDTGGSNPSVTMYWGTTDGGMVPADWDSHSTPTSPPQPQGIAAFFKNVSGLSSGTTYYYRAKAVNSAGTAWSDVSSFITAAPATITLGAATSVSVSNTKLNGNISNTGGDNPTVTMYWGTSDGGQTPASWQNNSTPTSPPQPQGIAAFYKNGITLALGRTYYFSASATNIYGTSWPANSLSFTVPAALATVTVSSASNVLITTATLNGNITDTGGSNPSVTMYWGTTDGGMVPADWDSHSTPTSPPQPQGIAAFFKNVSGLSSGTTYYYRAKAVNSAGTAWSDVSSFITH